MQNSHKGYDFDYKVADGRGNTHYHRAEADDKGTVRGTYGYKDTQGLHRVVDYIADASGFHAKIKTNEPGTDGKSPAYVEMIAEQPPTVFQGNYAEPVWIHQDKRIHGEADLMKNVDATGDSSVYSLIHRDKVQYPSAKLASETDEQFVPCLWRTLPVSIYDVYQAGIVGRDGGSFHIVSESFVALGLTLWLIHSRISNHYEIKEIEIQNREFIVKRQSQYEQGTENINKGDEPPMIYEITRTMSAAVNQGFRSSSFDDEEED
ncbi:hypothetical protein AVEN_44757-1 [Araneus ventricosus]|uniref:Cuticle protein 16.8 n=1 Tax=Araneus ventricosus TaxID=182803 RepID=A0A4Y2HQG0_ARAVE|nr:hypothetical protein AVEN_44757-1 [Araneus ventricosus]